MRGSSTPRLIDSIMASLLTCTRQPEVRALARLEGRRPDCGRFILRGWPNSANAPFNSHLRMTGRYLFRTPTTLLRAKQSNLCFNMGIDGLLRCARNDEARG